jgi:glutathione S-transferase
MTTDRGIELLGAPGSPYTRKMLALMRYRRIPCRIHWGGRHEALDGYPRPKVALLPTFYFPTANGEREAVIDSTFILRRLEREHEGRSVIPDTPALAFLDYLIEDFADEWLTKAMFHYRWSHRDDIANAGPLLTFWHNPQLPDADAAGFSRFISQRQIDRLHVVGSNPVTAATIEASFTRLIPILSDLIAAQGFILGARPAAADFALYGQLTQLATVDPTPAARLNKASPRLRAWIDRADDLSGLEPQPADWLSLDQAAGALPALLREIGRVYAPIMLANAAAVARGEESFTTEVDGREWTQPVFAYQAKCLDWLRAEFSALPQDDQDRITSLLNTSGCGGLVEAGRRA